MKRILTTQQSQCGYRQSLWHATAGSAHVGSRCPEGEHSADVAIIGGGITGLSAAFYLAKAGVDVVVLEAETIGFGASGRNGGYVVPNLSKVDPDDMVFKLGEPGELLAHTVGSAGQSIYDTIREEGIDCDARQGGWFQPAPSEDMLWVIERRHEQWQKRGFSVELLDRQSTERRTGCTDYFGSWYDPTGGTLDPLKFTQGLALRAEVNGCRIWTSCHVSDYERNTNRWRLRSGNTVLHTELVFVCTNALSRGLLPQVEQAVIPFRIYQFATAPLPENERRHLFQNGECLSDTRINLFTYRFDTDWRLITGQMPVIRAGAKALLLPLIARRLQRHLSLSQAPRIEFVWDGLATMTQEFMPQIFTLDTGLLAVTACNARGIAMSFQMGRALGQYALNNDPKDLPVPINEPCPMRNRWIMRFGSRLYPIYGLIKDP